MKLITKSSLTFISASVIFFLIGSIVMYFSVRTIVSTNLNSVLNDKKEEIVLQSKSSELNNYQSKNLIIEKSNHVSNDRFSDTVLIEDSKYVLYRKLDFYLDLTENQVQFDNIKVDGNDDKITNDFLNDLNSRKLNFFNKVIFKNTVKEFFGSI